MTDSGFLMNVEVKTKDKSQIYAVTMLEMDEDTLYLTLRTGEEWTIDRDDVEHLLISEV